MAAERPRINLGLRVLFCIYTIGSVCKINESFKLQMITPSIHFYNHFKSFQYFKPFFKYAPHSHCSALTIYTISAIQVNISNRFKANNQIIPTVISSVNQYTIMQLPTLMFLSNFLWNVLPPLPLFFLSALICWTQWTRHVAKSCKGKSSIVVSLIFFIPYPSCCT